MRTVKSFDEFQKDISHLSQDGHTLEAVWNAVHSSIGIIDQNDDSTGELNVILSVKMMDDSIKKYPSFDKDNPIHKNALKICKDFLDIPPVDRYLPGDKPEWHNKKAMAKRKKEMIDIFNQTKDVFNTLKEMD